MTKRRTHRRRNTAQLAARSLHHETLEKRELLAAHLGIDHGPRLISVASNSGEQFDLSGNNVLSISPTELTFRFDGAQPLDATTLSGIRLIASGGDGTFDDGNETVVTPGFLGFASQDNSRIVVARFAETLADDQYAIDVAGFDDTDPNNLIVGLRNVSGDLFSPSNVDDSGRPSQRILMNVEVGPRVESIVPQPIEGVGTSRNQLSNTIDVYFNNDPLSNPNAGPINSGNSPLSVVQTRFYQLVYTNDTIERTDDGGVRTPSSVEYDPVLNRARLTFSANLDAFVPASQNGGGTFRLRVGSGEAISSAPPLNLNASTDAGDTFATARNLGVTFGTTSQSIVIAGGNIQANQDISAPWPGATDPTGLRDYRRDGQKVGRIDTHTGINVYEYNFANLYGQDPQGNNLDNAITPAQRERVREILGLYSERLGVEFIETENRGLQIVTGDIRALAISADTGAGVPYSIYRVNDQDPSQGVLVMDAGENWYDGYGLSDNPNRPSWFVEALRGVGSLLGLGNTFELPAGDATGGSSPPEPNSTTFLQPGLGLPVEPDFLTQGNIIAGQALHRPEANDIDFYHFTASNDGRLSAEAFAQRLESSSLLDTHLELYRVIDAASGQYELVATNDDFFSDDSFIGVDLELPRDGNSNPISTQYILGVSASGNDQYDGRVENSGLGGVTEGQYELRVTFVPQVGDTITDTTGTSLDGDADGRAGGDFNFWFRVARDVASPAVDEPRVIFVDKLDGDDVLGNGTLGSPLKTIPTAFSNPTKGARPGDIVRLLPNAGADGLYSTRTDNLAYEIGRGGSGNQILSDGAEFEVPQGVTVMIDAGVILKLRSAKISVGSESVDEDRSLAALQILGTPASPLDANGNPIVEGIGTVYLTSYDDATLGLDTNGLNVPPQPGNWAGIEFRNDFELSEGRPVWEREGIFLDYSSHAAIRYGGGSVSATQPAISPISMSASRPTLIYNTITDSADAAISADPNSFREVNFHEPRFQRTAAFTSDYDRVGPEIAGNTLLRNTTNGLFVRVVTPAAGQTEPMTVAGRFDDRDIVHVLSQVLVLRGQPGGPLLLEDRPDVLSVTFNDAASGALTSGTLYDYKLTFVTSEGRESLASLPTSMRVAPAGGSIQLNSLPAAPAPFAGRRLYRFNPGSAQYDFIAELDRGEASYTDTGVVGRGTLPATADAASRLLPKFDARLSIDPGLILKLENSRIEAGFGADFYAEGSDGDPIVFTSRHDDSFGAGGTFDTNNGAATPNPGDWGGLVFRQDSTASLDFVDLRYGGGQTPSSGGFVDSNPIEILQADVRIAHSVLRNNADGFSSQSIRDGRGFNGPGTIFVRGSQPIIVDNTIIDNEGAAISINPDALDFTDNLDYGRATGLSNVVATDLDNQGPLIDGNRLDRNGINGLLVRSEVLQTESVWDDTDIVHVVQGQVVADSHYFKGGLRLRSDSNQSLVVKFDTGGVLTGTGRPLDIEDRIGGTIQVIGQSGFPVILTSLADDSVGAGFTPEGVAQTNTDNANGTPTPGDWSGIELLSYLNDRNVAYVLESERAVAASITQNASANNAQVIGALARDEVSSDENERLGFNIRGTLASDADQDVYRFEADGGTIVFIDIDDTSYGLDTIVELIDVNDQVLASSDNSFEERVGSSTLVNNLSPGSVRPLFNLGIGSVETENGLDAGMRVRLEGTGQNNQYFVRVRSKDASSSGQYQLAIRLREADEVAGSTVQLADIRYATNAITVNSAPLHSPLSAEATENVDFVGGNSVDVDNTALTFTNASATRLGNLLTTDRAVLRVSGSIGNLAPGASFAASDDVDVYQVDLFSQDISADVFDNERRFVSATFDIDYADALGRVNTSLAIYNAAGQLILHSRDSNIADDVGRPLLGEDATNLTGGSVGVLDAHIGPVELPEGTYYVAVSSAIAVPSGLDQFFEQDSTNPEVRLVPINSIRRIADDSINTFSQYTAEAPIVEPIFGASSISQLNLDDLRLFVSFDGGISGNNQSTLTSFNPFTGVMERLIGQGPQPIGDLAIRRDGELFTFSTGPIAGVAKDGGNTGNYINWSSADGSVTNVGDDGITFQRNNPAGADLENDDNAEFDISAIAFPLPDGGGFNTVAVNVNERFLVLGERDNRGRAGEIDDIYARNIIYLYQSTTGNVTSLGSINANTHRGFAGTVPYSPTQGAASPDVELGFVDTGSVFNTGGDGGDITGIGIVPFSSDPDAIAGNNFSTVLAVTDRGGVHFFDTNNTIPGPGDLFNRTNNIIPTTFYGVVQPDPSHTAAGALTDPTTGGVVFSGMTLGPRVIRGGQYRQTLFATTQDGWLYGLQIDGGQVAPANIFYNGRSAIPLTFLGTTPVSRAPNGIAFTTYEQTPWHFTNDRQNEFNHGIEPPFDGSRLDTNGGSSLYFGFEIDGNAANNTLARSAADPLGTLSPGGVQGSIISRPFSLDGYSPDDKPTLYFSYHAEVESGDDYTGPTDRQNDSFRAYAAGDDGSWILLATNNNFRSPINDDEFDEHQLTGIPVQELFDYDNAAPGSTEDTLWRQARVDISPLAGNKNVRIRFDFSTSGNFRHQVGSFELIAVDGDEIDDNELLILNDSATGGNVLFQTIVGRDVLIPDGSLLSAGDQFVLTGPGGNFTVSFVNGAAINPGEVSFTAGQLAAEIAVNVIAAIPVRYQAVDDGGGRISVLAASNVIVIGNAPIGQATPVQVNQNSDQLIIPDGQFLSSGEEFTITGLGTTTQIIFVEAIDATGAPEEYVFSTNDSSLDIATGLLTRFPVELDAILDPRGRITFMSGPIGFTYVSAPASNVVSSVAVNVNSATALLPNDPTDLVDGEQLVLNTGAGTVTITFSNQPISVSVTGNAGVVGYASANNRADLNTLLLSVLSPNVPAVITPSGAIQFLNASTAAATGGGTLIVTGTNVFSESLFGTAISDGVDLVDGEQLIFDLPGTVNDRVVTFVRLGSSRPPTGDAQIFFSDTDLGSDLYDDLLAVLPVEYQAFIDLGGNGINLGNVIATATTADGAPVFANSVDGINQLAIPLSLPSGANLNDGELITIIAADDLIATPITITFNQGIGIPLPGEVLFDVTDTAADIAIKVLAALPPTLQAYLVSQRDIYLLNASSVTTASGSAIVSFGSNATPILIDSTMTSEQITPILQSALAQGLGRVASSNGASLASSEQYPTQGGDRIRVFQASPVDTGSYGVSSFGLLSTPVDRFGEPLPLGFNATQIDSEGGANNQVEGIYIDDIIIGFAEHGEMVLNAPTGDRNFVLNPETIPETRPEAVQPERSNETLTGGYSLEVRTSDEYGVPEDFAGLTLAARFASLGRSFDTNDRLAEGAVTLIAQAGIDLIDGDTFVIDNGFSQMTFEFDSTLASGVGVGNVAIPFDPTSPRDIDTAVAIRNAINSPQARTILNITAATGDSLEVGTFGSALPVTSNRVELFGESIAINPGTGRFTKLDLVEEETYQGRVTAKLIPVIDHATQTVTFQNFGDQPARAAVAGFTDGSADVLVAVGKIGDQVLTGKSTANQGPLLLGTSPASDVDYVRIYVQGGQTIDIDVDADGFTRGAEVLAVPVITVLDDNGATVSQTSFFTPSFAPGEVSGGAFLKFTSPADGYYDVAISSGFGSGEYQLTIRPDALTSPQIPDRDVIMVDYHFGVGDVNRVDDQGQLILSSNIITDASGFGVLAIGNRRNEGFANGGLDGLPRPGAAGLLRNVNTNQWIPGTVISNNLIVDAAAGGISFSGGTQNNGQVPAAVPVGRIINNTVVGNGNGSGIIVQSSASPTLLNNLISGFATGLDVDASSLSVGTVVGGNAYHNNGVNSTTPLDSTALIVSGEVFQDPARRVFIPAAGSAVIDSSFSSLNDRTDFVNTVKQPVGIASSPIIAPLFDAFGQPRFDDPNINPPGPGGDIVTIDRGAVDRADREQPIAVLTTPEDAINTVVVGGDQDQAESFVRLLEGTVEFFEIQLLDDAGTGPDSATITPETVLLTENGRRLIPDVDFRFGYSDNSRTIRLTPLAGLWLPDAVYEITLNNQDRISYDSPAGSDINDGDQVSITDNDGNTVVFEYESGFSLQVPQSTLLTITGANNAFTDRDTFTISGDGGNSVTFEINLVGASTAGNVEINLANATTTGEVRDAILAALAGNAPGSGTPIATFLNIAPVAVGSGQIQLGLLSNHTAPAPITGLDVSGQPGSVADGETFTYTTVGTPVTFEFDIDGSVAAGNFAIPITRTETPNQVASAMVAQLSAAGLGLGNATATQTGVAVLGGLEGDQLDVSNSSLVLSGSPGVTKSLSLTIPQGENGLSIDGRTFSITSDGTTVNFRYTTDPALTSSDRLILVNPTELTSGIAAKTAAVIGAAFPDELSPSVDNLTITLGEARDRFTTVALGASGFTLGGISGGTIAVDFLTNSPATTTAASLVASIDQAVNGGFLNVDTFAPGGGSILISNVAQLQGGPAGSTLVDIGTLTPAIADLAGNPVRETRSNNETRFSIIMPDVVFDLGDAPNSFGTLLADNGARHTVNSEKLPRLGRSVDSETDGQPVGLDDALLPVIATSTSTGLFTIDATSITNTVTISIDMLPVGGEVLEVTIDGFARRYELIDQVSNPSAGNIPVVFTIDPLVSDAVNIERITNQLIDALESTVPQNDDGLDIKVSDTATNVLRIESIDDEDGVSIGQFTLSTTSVTYTVFLSRNADQANVQPTDVLGFLNPKDSAGANMDILVTGSGLLQIWIDFNKNGIFEQTTEEQVIKNLPVSGDPVNGSYVTVNVKTPSFATDGQTWMRVRFSESGDLRSTGVAVGGEVEDYQVEIISVDPPAPVGDSYTATEDIVLDTVTDGLPSVAANDNQLGLGFLPDQFILGEDASNGMVVMDAATGHFVYTPNPDYFGIDTFTYRVSTQQNESLASVSANSFVTVTINVQPVNDAPSVDAADVLTNGVYAQEDIPRIVSASELLAGAIPDAAPLYTTTGTTSFDALFASFLNEANQQATLSVAAILGADGNPITAANAASVSGNLSVTPVTNGLNVSVNNATVGDVISLSFAGTSASFELVPVGSTARNGTFPVFLVAGDTPTTIASRLAGAISSVFLSVSPTLTASGTGNTAEVRFTPLVASAIDNRDDANNDELIATSLAANGALTIDLLQTPVPTPAPTAVNPTPDVGDTVTVTLGATSYTFEFLADGVTAANGNIGIPMLPFAGPDSGQLEPAAIRQAAAIQLAIALETAFRADDQAAYATVADFNNPVSIAVTPSIISAGKAHATPRGTVTPLFDARGDLIELQYLSGLDLNRNNPPPANPTHTDEFSYQVRDNRLSIQLIDQTLQFGAEVLSTPGTVTIDVGPQNDAPVLRPDTIFGTEDTIRSIAPSLLLNNDSQARASAGDENVPGSQNDGALSIQSVTMVDPSQGSVILQGGNVVFTPAPNIFGDVLFTYSASDQGVNELAPGNRSIVPLTTNTGTVTVSIAAVNDPPTANLRSFTFAESTDAGVGPAFQFTSLDLIQGAAGETPNAPGDFPISLPAPFNESDQTLRIASFSTSDGTVDESSLAGVGLETLTIRSEAGLALDPVSGGRFEFDFVDGVFTVGRFFPVADYNQDFPAPALAIESLTYVVADDGNPSARSDDDPTATPAVISFHVTAENDAPTFSIVSPDGSVGGLQAVNVLEDTSGVQILNFARNILGGPATALDETRDQSVSFFFDPAKNASVSASGLFSQLPTLADDGTLTVFPAIDQIGTATLVVTAMDDVASPNTRETDQTFVINVRPVNDAPRFESNLNFPVSDSASADDAYDIARVDTNSDGQIDDASITYTLKEDNTQAEGDTSQDFFIPLRANFDVGYNRVGLLDVFNVGPTNEASASAEGGAQTISLLTAGQTVPGSGTTFTTDRGGVLTEVTGTGGELIGFNYRPPVDFNFVFAGLDSFSYTVIDDSNTGGETFDLVTGQLVPNRLTTTNRVELHLNPVNDRPEFNVATLTIDVQEDTTQIDFESFATGISAGPANSAFDELDANTGQLVEFTVTLLGFTPDEAEELFTVFPTIDEQSGLLSFQPAPDVFGNYEFEVVLSDFNRDGTQTDNSVRGDLISSIPITMTINVRPVNDPPRVDPNAAPLVFNMTEDGTLDILVSGDGTNRGLLDVFLPGPNIGETDESADIAPLPGANQTVDLDDTIPATSANNGTITLQGSGQTRKLIYTPAANFVGTDSFIYTVIDDGQTIGIDGVLSDDPRIAIHTVTIEVAPVNDAPQFSGAEDVGSDEDQGTVVIPAWATNAFAGPTTAADEVKTETFDGQELNFVFTLFSGDASLFQTLPTAVRQTVPDDGDPNTPIPVLRDFDLTYVTAPDANGEAVFTVVLEDNGPNNLGNGDQHQSAPVRTFTISVAPINDPPTVNVVDSTITIDEDHGPFSQLQLDPFSVGPPDEQSQVIQFTVQPLDAQFATLFTELPTVDNQGVLRLTVAPNANSNGVGPIPITVVATDSGPGAPRTEVTFNLVVNEVDDAPRAVRDSFNSDEDTVLTITSEELRDNDSDPDLTTNPNEFNRVVLPAFSTSASGAGISYNQTTGVITYDPTNADLIQSLAPGNELRDSFSYSLIDSTGLTSNLVSVEIVVSGINDAPVLGLDTPTLNPDGPTVFNPLENDTDIDGFIDAGSIQITLQPAFGALEVQPNGTMIYTPFGSFGSEDLFRYTVADNLGLRSEEQLVSIAANQSPIARDDARGTFLNESVLIDVAANDVDPDGTLDLSGITIVRTPVRGEAVPQSDGTVQYLPDPGFTGVDTFEYRIADQEGRLSNVAEVTVQVVSSRLQNPDRFSDVNDDGFVTALDALLIINRLSRTGGQGEIPVIISDVGPNFYDVSGDQSISALDALRVVNELARINNRLDPNGEQVAFLSEGRVESASNASEDPITTIASEVERRISDFGGPLANMDQTITVISSEGEQGEDQISAIDDVLRSEI